MRYLFGFLCVCALGVMPLVGCFNDILEGNCPGGCNDGNECTLDDCLFFAGCVHDPVNEGRNCSSNGVAGVCLDGVCDHCAGVVCDDDGNECTWDCNPETGTCDYIPLEDGTDCRFDGLTGVCVSGVCGEDPCEGVVCDEPDNLCGSDQFCNWVGVCEFRQVTHCYDGNSCTVDECDPDKGCVYTQRPNGANCAPDGSCCLLTGARECCDGTCLDGICVPD